MLSVSAISCYKVGIYLGEHYNNISVQFDDSLDKVFKILVIPYLL